MKIKAIIIEDELPARTTIKSYLNRYFPNIEVVGEAGEMASAKALITQGNYDFIFLDVHLKDGNSIDLLNSVNDKLRIIFTTAYDQYTIQAFSFKAFGYILKPLSPIDFKEIVNRVVKDILINNVEHIKLKIATAHGSAFIDTSEIVHCTAESNYTNIHCSNNKVYLVSKTLKLLEDELSATGKFIRIHQSHLVNIDYINEKLIGSGYITLNSGDQLPVSRARRNELLLKISRGKDI